MSNYLAYGNKVISGGGGNSSSSGGHIIEDASGTELEQREVLKFAGGLKATDDSINGKTIIDDSPTEIEWDDWIEMTAEEKAAIPKALVLNAPGIDGDISANIFTKLWENPDPTATFAAQNITLSSDDYDFLLFDVIHKQDTFHLTFLIHKGSSVVFNLTATGSNNSVTRQRNATYVSDTVYTIDDGYSQNSTSSRAKDNTLLIPHQVYGIKKTINLDVSVIAADVSTSADKCMMSDGVTSVEDIISSPNIIFEDDSQSYTLPAVGGGVDVIKNITAPDGYIFIGVINAISNTSKCACSAAKTTSGSTYKALLSIVNVGNSTQVGTTRNASWTNVYKKR